MHKAMGSTCRVCIEPRAENTGVGIINQPLFYFNINNISNIYLYYNYENINWFRRKNTKSYNGKSQRGKTKAKTDDWTPFRKGCTDLNESEWYCTACGKFYPIYRQTCERCLNDYTIEEGDW